MGRRRTDVAASALIAGVWVSACTAPNPAYRAPSPADAQLDSAPLTDASVPTDGASPPTDGAAAGSDLPPVADGAPPLSTAPLARWRLDPAAGAGVPDDAQLNHGTLEGTATWSTQASPGTRFANPGSLQLDGAAAYVRLGTSGLPSLQGSKTVSLWFWIAATPTAPRKTLMSFTNAGRSTAIHVGLERGKVAIWGWNSAIGSGILYAVAAAAPGWHHVGYTYDGNRHILYMEGSTQATSNGGGWQGPVLEALLGTFGANDRDERFDGRIDDVRLYDRALTWQDMAALAQGAP